jgi:hypothetical protein
MKVETREGAEFGQIMGHEVQAAMEFIFRTGCNCGCGQPDRLDVIFLGGKISIIDPVVVDRLIAVLQNGRAKLWGDLRP